MDPGSVEMREHAAGETVSRRAPLHRHVAEDEAVVERIRVEEINAAAVAAGVHVGHRHVRELERYRAVAVPVDVDPAAVAVGHGAVDEVDVLEEQGRPARRGDDPRRPSPSIVAPAPRPTILTPRPAGMTSSSPPSAKVVPCEGGRSRGVRRRAVATPCVRDVPHRTELDHYDAGAREFDVRAPRRRRCSSNLAAPTALGRASPEGRRWSA